MMEEVPEIPVSIPSLAPYPPEKVIRSLPPEEWQACLDMWIFCLEFRLRLLPEHFHHFRLSQNASGILFVSSYFQSIAQDAEGTKKVPKASLKEDKLRKNCFFLLRRLLLEAALPYDCKPLILFELLADVSIVLGRTSAWREVMKLAWERSSDRITGAIEATKTSIINNLPHQTPSESSLRIITRATALVKAFTETGVVLMTGSDYLEALITAYSNAESNSNTTGSAAILTEHIYFCLCSLVSANPPRSSTLIDHIYTLKSEADKTDQSLHSQGTLLSSLICLTTFLRHLDVFLATTNQSRGQQLLSYLRMYRDHTRHIHGIPLDRRKKQKGKGKSKSNDDHEMHIHQAARLSQIQELFPNLSQAYIMKLFDYFADNVEAVTAALLEPETLPETLRHESGDDDVETSDNTKNQINVPASNKMPLPVQKRNIFDGDDFDNLQISSSNIHRGKKDVQEVSKDHSEHAKSKAAILAALAAFDSDDDERDDTYDVADVGGTVDSTLDTDERRPRAGQQAQADPSEELLYRTWKAMPDLFARDSKTRLSQPRQQLKRDTGMDNEQIEGFAVMLSRDSAQHSRLEKKYLSAAAFTGNQKGLASSKWSAPHSGPGTEEDEDSETAIGEPNRGTGDDRRMGATGIRGGRTFGARGGGVAGSSNALSTTVARKRKEQGRGRGGANHNRRDGRARKIGRGMAGPMA